MIIFNSSIRKLKKNLDLSNIKYKDFMFSKKILGIKTYSEQFYFISRLSSFPFLYNNLTKNMYNFLLNIYIKDTKLFDDIISFIEVNGYNFTDDEIDFCRLNVDILKSLIDIKKNDISLDVFNQNFINNWGKSVIEENYNIIPLIKFKDVKEYINLIKENPNILKLLYSLIENNNQIFINEIIKLTNKTDINKIVKIINNLGDKYLKYMYLENYDNIEISNIISKIAYSKMEAGDLRNISEKFQLSPLLLKKFNYYYNYYTIGKPESKVDPFFQKMMLSLIIEHPIAFIDIIKDAKRINYSIPENIEKFYNIYNKIQNKAITNGEIIDLVYEEIFKKNNKNNSYFLNWIKEFKSYEINKNLINVNDAKTNHYETYTYTDKLGNKIEKKIPIIIIDDPNFRLLIHVVQKKNKISSTDNYRITEKLVDNPENWLNITYGNPNISMSYCCKSFYTFSGSDDGKSCVTLGFSNIDPKRLEATFSSDGGTSMYKTLEKEKFGAFAGINELETINGTYTSPNNSYYKYNEILIERYINNQTIKPDYIFLEPGTKYKELAYKWAAYFNIPIVELDRKKIKDCHNKLYNTYLNIINEKSIIEDYDIIQKIFEERALYNLYSENYYDKYTFFDTFYNITKNLDFTISQNRNYILKLLNKFSNEDIWKMDQFKTDNYGHYIDPRMSDDKVEEYHQYMYKIKNICQKSFDDVIDENMESHNMKI